ncbi:hypothetical protein [Rhodoferax saidenbachensis]|uniref:Outer membrane protein beta-barrel domain-containing protein n=1 Tax=Rhodoferax saidenbachensis TaxID=1484693 RepID=A0ABU1ZJU5_9BURK|nr:hypothetical protein [Rhodoferax saidenbachensis]MDR7305818.1 hypothetical protein [Rhodoferax saidenbachensis]
MKTRCYLLLVSAACVPWAAWADAGPPDAGALWVNLGGFSSHVNRDKDYNENNVGMGVEYRLQPDVALMAGAFNNSIRQTTTYAAVSWQPLSLGGWKLGAALGVMNGYPGIAHGGAFLAALPMASYEGTRFGMNLGLIPSINNKVDGAFVIQLKFRMR